MSVIAVFEAIAAAAVERWGARLLTMVGADERPRDNRFRLYYTFELPSGGGFVTLVCPLGPEEANFPSVTPRLPAANWYEREVRDLLGLEPEGHPDPRRLVLHENWPPGVYPLRKDFPGGSRPERTAGDFPFLRVQGDGVMEIPVGPIHAGIIEPGHFRLSAVGELIIHLETRLFFTHRGLEKEAEGRPLDRGVFLAERACGVCALSHATAYAQAVECLSGVEAPPRARFIRTIALELERLYNHIGDVGNICAGTGLHFGTSQGARLKEELQRLNDAVFGHRFLRGVAVPGGVGADLDAERIALIKQTVDRVEGEFEELVEVLMASDSFLDRLRGTGRLAPETARDLGVVGVAARASGIDRDARRDHPYAAYAELDFSVPVRTAGDVEARLQVRVEEALQSFRLIRRALAGLPPGPVRLELNRVAPYKTAIGIVESPRGDNVHWLMSGPGETIFRYRIRSASYANWPAVPFAVAGNIVPDFPLINKSFELCYACLDR